MIDHELVTRKMVLITADVNAVEPLAQHPLEDYLANPTDKVLVERYQYDEIDHERVYEGLQAAMRDVPEYLRHVQRYVNEDAAAT